MCLIAWNWQPASPTPMLLIANRDEFYARPTQALHWWDGGKTLAGRDLQAGGTWLGINRSGRLAALTNHRNPSVMRPDAPSRGELVTAFLQDDVSAPNYLMTLAQRAANYNPFNLLVYDGTHFMGLESRHARVFAIAPGVGAVSNADFDTAWPKLTELTQNLQILIDQGQASDARLLALLANRRKAPDPDLPKTGVPLHIERTLSATFIATPDYGTRACSVLRLETGHARFLEKSFGASGSLGESQFSFALE